MVWCSPRPMLPPNGGGPSMAKTTDKWLGPPGPVEQMSGMELVQRTLRGDFDPPWFDVWAKAWANGAPKKELDQIIGAEGADLERLKWIQLERQQQRANPRRHSNPRRQAYLQVVPLQASMGLEPEKGGEGK